MKNPLRFIAYIADAIRTKRQAERFAARWSAEHAAISKARIASGIALCPICHHGEIAVVDSETVRRRVRGTF